MKENIMTMVYVFTWILFGAFVIVGIVWLFTDPFNLIVDKPEGQSFPVESPYSQCLREKSDLIYERYSQCVKDASGNNVRCRDMARAITCS